MESQESPSPNPQPLDSTEQASSTVVVDALPYIDHGYDEPGVREAVGVIFIEA